MPISTDVRALMATINKKYGDGALIVASESVTPPPFPTGCLSLDGMLAGGWPANQWSEVAGKESSGKTSMVHKTIAINQYENPDFSTLWVAAEGYDREWASALGVDTDRVVIYPTCGMEDAYSVMLEAIASKKFDCIVLDSYPALVPEEEEKKGVDESTVAIGARVTGKFFRKAGIAGRRVAGERPFFGIFINQYRVDIGAFSPHGPAWTTPGGNAKNYAFYVRLEVKRKEFLDEKNEDGLKQRVGQTITFKTMKSKVSRPQQVMSVDFFFESTASGMRPGDYDTAKEIVILGQLHGVIARKGHFYSVGDQRWSSQDALLAAVRENGELQRTLYKEIVSASCG